MAARIAQARRRQTQDENGLPESPGACSQPSPAHFPGALVAVELTSALARRWPHLDHIRMFPKTGTLVTAMTSHEADVAAGNGKHLRFMCPSHRASGLLTSTP
jgi:hypothetical protein